MEFKRALLAAAFTLFLPLQDCATFKPIRIDNPPDNQYLDQNEIEEYLLPGGKNQESRRRPNRENRQRGRYFEDERTPKIYLSGGGYPC